MRPCRPLGACECYGLASTICNYLDELLCAVSTAVHDTLDEISRVSLVHHPKLFMSLRSVYACCLLQCVSEGTGLIRRHLGNNHITSLSATAFAGMTVLLMLCVYT